MRISKKDAVIAVVISLIVGGTFVMNGWAATPSILSVTPDSGMPGAAADVTIQGTNFEPGAKVSLLSGGAFPVGHLDTYWAEYVAIQGNYAYLADWHAGIKVIDITDPTAPSLVGSLDTPGIAVSLAVSGDYVFLAANESVRTIDVSDPANPLECGFVANPDIYNTWNIELSNGYAYVAVSSGVAIVDISSPCTPQYVGLYISPPMAVDVVIQDTIAYVVYTWWTLGQGLQVVDISNPQSPVLLGQIHLDFRDMYGLRGLSVVGNYAYVANGPSLDVIDVSDPANPVEVNLSKAIDGGQRITSAGTRLFIADSEFGVKVMDITDPVAPKLVESIDVGGGSSSLYGGDMGATKSVALSADGRYGYVANHSDGLRVVDFSVLGHRVPEGSCRFPGYAWDVDVSGSYSYLASYGQGLQICDVTDPGNPVHVGAIDTGLFTRALDVQGSTAYVASQSGGLQIVDISDPAAPALLGNYAVRGSWPMEVVARGSTVYYVGEYQLVMLDVSNPAAPVKIGELNTLQVGRDIVVATDAAAGNTYAYISWGSTNPNSDLLIVDVSDPANPVQAGSVSTGGIAGGVAAASSSPHIFMANGPEGFHVIDVSIPGSPAIVASYTHIFGKDVTVSGDRLFVADSHAATLWEFDVSDPGLPALAGSYILPDAAVSSFISAEHAYVATHRYGLQVVERNDPVTNTIVESPDTVLSTFPAGLRPGIYHVMATNPGGEEGILHNGFQASLCGATDTDGDGIGDACDNCTDMDQDTFSTEGGGCGLIDCNDADPLVNPGTMEFCDGADNNCDGRIDEGFDADGDGYKVCGGDCDDTNPAVYPDAIEVCGNSLDENCNGMAETCTIHDVAMISVHAPKKVRACSSRPRKVYAEVANYGEFVEMISLELLINGNKMIQTVTLDPWSFAVVSFLVDPSFFAGPTTEICVDAVIGDQDLTPNDNRVCRSVTVVPCP